MTSLHIAVIGARGVPATFGGVERHVEEIGSRLADRGHRVDVYCRPHYSDNGTEPTATYRGMNRIVVGSVNTQHLEAFSHAAIATRAATKTSADVFHFHAIGPGAWSFLPRIRRRRAVVAQTIHGLDFDRDKWSAASQRILRTIARASAPLPHLTIGVSRALVDEYRTRYGREITYVPNGVTRPDRTPPGQTLQRLGLEAGRYVLFVGRLVPEKSVVPLVEAFCATNHDLKLAIVGGSSHTDDYTERVMALADRDDRVVAPGYLYGSELEEVYSNAGLFVLPSVLEGLPLTLLEALSYRLPVLASDIPAHREILQTSNPGRRMFTSGDWRALQEELEAAMTNLGAEISAATGDTGLLDEYDWDAVTDQTEAEYFKTLESRRS